MPRERTDAPAGSPCMGSTTRYASEARKYTVTTKPVPRMSESGMLRFGFFTSPAVKVMLFQASAEKSDPTCTTARTMRRLTIAVGPPTPTWTGCRSCQPAFCQKLCQPGPKFDAMAVALTPTVKASKINPASEGDLAGG